MFSSIISYETLSHPGTNHGDGQLDKYWLAVDDWSSGPSQGWADLDFDILNDLLPLHHCPLYCVRGIQEKGMPWPLGWVRVSIITQPLGRERGSLCPLLRGPVQSDDYSCSAAASFCSSEELHFGFSEPLVGMWINETALQIPATLHSRVFQLQHLWTIPHLPPLPWTLITMVKHYTGSSMFPTC